VARDIPEYEQNEITQPGTAPSGFSEAFSQVGKSYEPIAQFGLQLAQNASNQRAQQQAIEDAQTPGRKIWPGLLPNDAEYNRIYKQEEANVIQHQGNQFLRKAYEELAKNPNPTASTLQDFEQGTKSGLDDLVNQADKSSRPAIKRAFQDAYEGYFYDLGHKVAAHGIKYQDEQRASQFESNRELTSDAVRAGRFELADKYNNKAKELLDIEAQVKDWSPEKLQKMKDESDEFFKGDIGEYECSKLEEKDKPAYIASLRENPEKHAFLKDLGPNGQDRVINQIQKFAANYDSAFKAQQDINYINALTDYKSGSLTAGKLESFNLDAKHLASLNYEITKDQRKDLLNKQNHQAVLSVADRPDLINNFSEKQINAAAKEQLAQASASRKANGQNPDMNLSEQVQALSNFKSPVSFLTKNLNGGVKSSDPKIAADAAEAINFAMQKNPYLANKLENDTISFAKMFDSRRKTSEDRLLSAVSAQGKVYNVDAKTLERRDENWKTITKDKHSNYYLGTTEARDNFVNSNLNLKTSAIAGPLGWVTGPLPKIPDFVTESYIDLFYSNYRISDNMDDAKELTNDALNRSFRYEEVNGGIGKTPYSYAPISKFIPPEKRKEGMAIVKSQLWHRMEETGIRYKQLFDKDRPESDFYYEISSPKNKDFPILVKKIYRSGEIKRGALNIVSDNNSTMVTPGTSPSFRAEFKEDGKLKGEPILDPNEMSSGNYIRFTPNLSSLSGEIEYTYKNKGAKEKELALRKEEHNRETNRKLKELEDYYKEYGEYPWTED
jgi:hypothetical protein